MGARDVVDL